jgi:hypothetical protein
MSISIFELGERWFETLCENLCLLIRIRFVGVWYIGESATYNLSGDRKAKKKKDPRKGDRRQVQKMGDTTDHYPSRIWEASLIINSAAPLFCCGGPQGKCLVGAIRERYKKIAKSDLTG